MRIDLPNNLLSMRKHEKDGCDHGQKVRTTHFYFFLLLHWFCLVSSPRHAQFEFSFGHFRREYEGIKHILIFSTSFKSLFGKFSFRFNQFS